MYNDHTTGISVEGSRLASQLSRSICWGTGNVRRTGNLRMRNKLKKLPLILRYMQLELQEMANHSAALILKYYVR